MKNILSSIIEWVICIIVAIILTLLIKTFLFDIIRVSGTSMVPTLHDKDIVGVEKLSLYKNKFDYKDIVIFDSRNEKHNIYIKRVIGLPGDTVEIKDGGVYINGEHLNETYLDPNTTTTGNLSVTLDDSHIFVLGDNREVSEDSRQLGPIPIDSIKGHAVFRFFPLSKIGTLK